MLPAYDALVEGLKIITDENVKKGLEMVERVFIQSLAELNIHPIQSVGVQFDPKYHNIAQKMPGGVRRTPWEE